MILVWSWGSLVGAWGQFEATGGWADVGFGWFLTRAVQEGHVSASGAESLLGHVAEHGMPGAPEEAWRVAGLSPREQQWLCEAKEWHALCHRTKPESQDRPVKGVFTVNHRFADTHLAQREVRLRAGEVRGRMHAEDSVRLSGSWRIARHGWVGVLGDHALRWGQGLTVPRSDPFGLALFLGSSEVRLPFAPTPLDHSEFSGGLRGAALEHQGGSWTLGMGVGKDHVAAVVRRAWPNHEWCGSAFRTDESARWGVDWTGRMGRWDGQGSAAWEPSATALRASVRAASSRSWVMQVGGDARRERGVWTGEIRAFGTWVSTATGGQVQMRVRGRPEGDWDVRAQGRVLKDHPVTWSLVGTESERLLGLHAQTESFRAALWIGQNRHGRWSMARHAEATWNSRQGGTFGVYGTDGNADWEGAYVALPMLDVRQWTPAPRSGWRMGVWARTSRDRWVADKLQWRGAWQCSWAPSQQETFRCAYRIRWDA